MGKLRTNSTGFWWVGKPNFGDLLTPLLFDYFTNIKLDWAPLRDAQLVCVGSILEQLPKQWPGIVLGSGKLFETKPVNLINADVLALRGPLTVKNVTGLKGKDFALGDLGLLVNDLVAVNKEYNLGIVPHWSDTALEHRFKEFNPHIIRPSNDPLEVIREIGRCRKIVSSSLHGIIVADAFGIPRRIEMTSQFAKEGGDFKFQDHNLTVGVKHKIGLTQEAPRYKIQDVQSELYDAINSAGRKLTGAER